MALTALQRKKLINDCNSINIKTLITYIQSGDITLEDLPNLSEEKKQAIIGSMNDMPNAQEQQEWAGIRPILSKLEAPISSMDSSSLLSLESQLKSLLGMIDNYIRHWEGKRPSGNHVDEANQCHFAVERKLQEITAIIEQKDWETVDPFSKASLLGHIAKYPNTSHRDEIDETVWGLTNNNQVADLQEYLKVLPGGRFANEAKAMLGAIIEWEKVQNSRDIFMVNDYIQSNPNSPYLQQAETELLNLKQHEIEKMRSEPNRYGEERLVKLSEARIFYKDELIHYGVMTEKIWDTIFNPPILPDVNDAIESSIPECKDGFTDVFFFGVPSTGKTCVLMGLSRSGSLSINLAHGGGDYAAALQQYTDVGKTVPRTPGNKVTTLEATIRSRTTQDAEHRVNLVEMSGEEFAFDIASNKEKIYTFEDMGTGATALLSNGNRKVFFLIIDPTANAVTIDRQVIGYDEETGEKIKLGTESCVAYQRTLLQKMVNMFQNPGNAEIMRKVDSIHIIVTKADTLGDIVKRNDRALDIFRQNFEADILYPLIKLCKEYNINVNQRYHPNLYTFSLGQFYVGGLYEYDNTDSDKLVRAICNSTQVIKEKSFWDKVKDAVN